MGVKTLDPSDYALILSVTTHLSGVQLLPTVQSDPQKNDVLTYAHQISGGKKEEKVPLKKRK